MTVMTASPAHLPRSPEILTDRLRERGLKTRLVSPPYIRYLFTNDRFADVEKRLKEAAVPANTDIQPVCYPVAVMSWLARFFPKLALAELPGFGAAGNGLATIGWILGIGLPLLFFGSRLRPAWRRGLLAAVAGFLGIVSEAVLILAYQAKEGVLYQDIGLLLAAVMAGLALGAPVLRDLILGTGVRKKRARGWGVALLAGFGLLNFAAIGIVTGGVAAGLFLTALLLAATGFLVGGLFAYAGLCGVREQKKVIGPLYAADLIGGCLGAILGSLAFIPIFGLAGTLKGMILLAALALLLI
jgi:spermidine synthase